MRKMMKLSGSAFVALSMSLTASLVSAEEGAATLSLPLISSDEQQRHLSEQKKSTALYSEGESNKGAHYVNLYVGTPPQLQTLAIGLGHGVTSFPCDDCEGNACGSDHKSTAPFDRTASESFIDIACAKHHHCLMHGASCSNLDDSGAAPVGECTTEVQWELDSSSSWTAVEAYDQCFLGGTTEGSEPDADNKFGLHFGCQTDASGYYRDLISDGVLGLSPHPSSFVQQMYEAGKIHSPTFSVCVAPLMTAERGSETGSLTMGGLDSRLHHKSEMSFARLHHTNYHYNLALRHVYVRTPEGGDSVHTELGNDPSNGVGTLLNITKDGANGNGVLLDSLSPYSFLDHQLFNAFKEVFEAIAGEGSATNGKTLTHEQVSQLPTLLFQLVAAKGVTDQTPTTTAAALDPDHPHDVMVAFPPTSYMVYDANSQVYGLGLFKATGMNDKSILGNNFLSGHDIFFDIDNKRIGWAESSCSFNDSFTTDNDSKNEDRKSNDRSGNSAIVKQEDGTCTSGVCRGATSVFIIFLVLAAGYALVSCWKRRQGKSTFKSYSISEYQDNLAAGATEKDADTSHETADSSLDSINIGEII